MKAGNYFAFLIIAVIIIGGCNAELELIPQDVEFLDLSPASGTDFVNTIFEPSWTCKNSLNKYDFLFGYHPDSLSTVYSNLQTPDCTVTNLTLSTEYYWQVVAYNVIEEPFYSKIMNFSTRDPIWEDFYPEDGAADLPLNTPCVWSFGGDDVGEVTYSFYLGTEESSLEKIASGFYGYSIELDSLLFDTTYFWQVSMDSDVAALDSTEVMNFTTVAAQWNMQYPPDGAESVDVDVPFTWDVGQTALNEVLSNRPGGNRADSNGFSYKLYFGISPDNLIQFPIELDSTYIQVAGFDYRTNYYWQVQAEYLGTQILESPVNTFNTRDLLINYYPENGGRHIPVDIELSWEADDSDSYDVYFGTESGNLLPLALVYTDNSFALGNVLDYSTEYFWRIDAHRTSGEVWEGEELSFLTTIDPIPPGNKFEEFLLRAENPCYIDIVYQVQNMAGTPVRNISDEDFMFLEDGEEVDPEESLLEIKSGAEIPRTSKIVLMIDNSSSMGVILDDIKLAALTMVANLPQNQELAIFEFSEEAVLLTDFTNDRLDLERAINDIESGFASTDLYGSFITGVQHWEDFYFPENLIEGNLILITDGSDTQGSSSLYEALEARGDHKVFTIGIGDDIDEYALEQIANQRYYRLGSIAQLTGVLGGIQQETSDYLDSFYWLHYMTPKRGDVDHSIEISLVGNMFAGNGSKLEGSFNSADFFGILPGVFINVNQENEEYFGIEEYTINDSANHVLTAHSYFADQDPHYVWSIGDTHIITMKFAETSGSRIIISAGSFPGRTTLTVTDIANNYTREIDVISHVAIRED